MKQWKQTAKGLILAMVMAVGLCGLAHATPGDVNGDDAVSLEDAVISLQAVAGMTDLEIALDGDWDVGGDAVGLAEAVYALKYVAENSGLGDTFTNPLGMTFVRIPAETFMMGSPRDEPGRGSDETQHQVTLNQDFYMMTTEVTQAQWEAVMGSNPSYFDTCGENCPVETVSWNDVQDFITALNAMGGRTYRLPTEAEWEYAARAETQTPFAFGECLSTDQANYVGYYPMTGCPAGEYRKGTVEVGTLGKNAWNLHDMHGNVWEWCQDWCGTYPTGAVSDPTGPAEGSNRVLRGGSWYCSAENCRSALRYAYSPSHRNSFSGFRLALSPGR